MLNNYATTVHTDDKDEMHVIYHKTAIVSFDQDKITLRSGGWETVTTKRKMNQASEQFNLKFSVYQKDYVWYVVTPQGHTIEFTDGITLKRHHNS